MQRRTWTTVTRAAQMGDRVILDFKGSMDGVEFPDMPWTLDEARPASGLKAEIAALWPAEAKRYPRFYALGIDAYHVIGQLNGLRRDRAKFFPGETGDLSLDMANRLQRHLLWSRFIAGVPQRLQDFQ